MKYNVHVIDDEEVVRVSLQSFLEDEDCNVYCASSGEEGLSQIEQHPCDLSYLDLRLPGIDGHKVLKGIKALDSNILVVLMTAYGTVESAVSCMKDGAFDYLTKPLSLDQLSTIMDRAREILEGKKEFEALKKQVNTKLGFKYYSSQNHQMIQLYEQRQKICLNPNATILIEGESGTGKEIFAKACHYESLKCDKPFIAINCGAIPEQLAEAELFGYERGAFTGALNTGKKGRLEMGSGGTVFLDEITELPLSVQSKLLRFIEEKEIQKVGAVESQHISTQIIVATNKNLANEVRKGNFREDLYYRLNIFPFYLPPLRERKEDIIPLTKYFIDYFNIVYQKSVAGIDYEVRNALLEHTWPGNIRELRSVVERAVSLCDSRLIDIDKLIIFDPLLKPKADHCFFKVSNPLPLQDLTNGYIERVLNLVDGNKTRAAELLGIDRKSVTRKLSKSEDGD